MKQYEKFMDMFSDSSWQLIFRKLPLVLGIVSKKNVHSYWIKILFFFPTPYVHEARFYSYASKVHNRTH